MDREAELSRWRAAAPVIAPSMLKCDFGRLAQEVERLAEAGADVLHWDVMDGHFVPNLSYGPLLIRRLREFTDLPFDAHLMISEPDRYLDEYLDAGCQCVTFHVETVQSPSALLERIRAAGAIAGLAVNPNTPVAAVEPELEHCDLVLVMSVEPGFGGQKFIPGSLDKLRKLRGMMGEEQILAVDGGIGPGTIEAAGQAGADYFVVGSAIFEAEPYTTAVTELRSQAGGRISA